MNEKPRKSKSRKKSGPSTDQPNGIKKSAYKARLKKVNTPGSDGSGGGPSLSSETTKKKL